MDQSGAAGYPQKANEAMQQPPPPKGPPPPYSSVAEPGKPQNFGSMQSPPPGQLAPTHGQPEYVHHFYPGQSAPLQPGVQYGYPATDVVVLQPGVVPRTPTQPRPQPKPESYMLVSIVGCIFCVWPLGIGAIIASLNVQNALARGDIASAKKSSHTAKLVNIINFLIGFVFMMIFTILFASFRTRRRIYY